VASMMGPSRALLASLALLAAGKNGHALEATLSCEAFKVKPNGNVSVVKPVMLGTPFGKVALQPGVSFNSKEKVMGLDVYGLYRRACPEQ
jgi:hypothetical protein